MSEFLLSLAQQGDSQAIAALIDQALRRLGITATANLEDTCLNITLIREQNLPQDACLYVVREGMRRLNAASIDSVRVIGLQTDSKEPAWIQTFKLPITAPSPPINLPSAPPKPKRRKLIIKHVKRIPLLWLNGMIWLLIAGLGAATLHYLRQQTVPKAPKPQPQVTSVVKHHPRPKVRLTPPQRLKKPAKAIARPMSSPMWLKGTIIGKITPKSVVYSGQGLFFAQNMMYSHTITVYNRKRQLVKTIPDSVNLAFFGYKNYNGFYQGAPVEVSFSHNGKYAWVSNYQMYGRGFNNPGSDRCSPAQNTDYSFLYRINSQTLKIEKVIQVGSVPKYVATTPDNRLVLVSNWCSWDLSVIDPQKNREIKRIPLGPYPRGIVVDAGSKKAYVAVMGSYDIAQIDLKNFSVNWIRGIGHSPRHLNLEPSGKFLYASLNGEGRIAKISLQNGQVIAKAYTGAAPRSMVLSHDGQRLYVVNYSNNSFSKVRTADMKVLQTVKVSASPIGITYDPKTREVWVACYSGSIQVFQD